MARSAPAVLSILDMLGPTGSGLWGSTMLHLPLTSDD